MPRLHPGVFILSLCRANMADGLAEEETADLVTFTTILSTVLKISNLQYYLTYVNIFRLLKTLKNLQLTWYDSYLLAIQIANMIRFAFL